MRIRTLWGITLLLALTLGIAACGSEEPTPTTAPPATPTATSTTTQPADGGNATGEVVNIIQHETPYSFEPATFAFEVNKTYALTFASVGEFHTFTVRDLGIDIFILPGEAVQVDVTPSKVGTFQLICVPHEGLGMVGEVIVQ